MAHLNIGRIGGGVFTQQTAGEVQRSTFWQNGAITPATHTFAVRAIDGAGNVDPTPATRTFRSQRCNVLQAGVDLLGNPVTICL